MKHRLYKKYMRIKSVIKKGAAVTVATAMVLSLAPSLSGIGEVYAESTDSAKSPSVTVYADKDTLNGETFDPGSTGTSATAVAKLKFGRQKDSGEEKAIEWYILGADSNINKPNTAIFAADNIGSTIYFHPGTEERAYDADRGNVYVSGTAPSVVEANHYGQSWLLLLLREITADESIYSNFTEAEKKRIQDTTVLTHEYNSEDQRYTTSDKLYLPSAKGENEAGEIGVIYVGNKSNSDALSAEYECKALPSSIYWKPDSEGGSKGAPWFWLRSPHKDYNYMVLYAEPSTGLIGGSSVTESHCIGIRPAANIDLTDVLFASAAPAAATDFPIMTDVDEGYGGELSSISGDENQAAMTLRLDGKDKNIGKFIECTKDAVTVQATASNVVLVVQGNDGTKDWFYRVSVPAGVTVEVLTSHVIDTAGIDGSLDFTSDNLKIWLEIPVAEDGGTMNDTLSYAISRPHEHTYDDTWTEVDGDQHAHLCTSASCPDRTGSAKDPEAHTYGDDNVCTECGYRYGDHIVTYVPEKAATSTTVGYKEHYECSHCSNWFKYPAKLGILESESKSYFEIPATGNRSSGNRNSDRYKRDSGSSSGRSSGASGTIAIINNGSTTGWSKDASGRWWYYDGNTKVIGWVYDKPAGKWYYVDESKGMLTGWIQDTVDGYWYYLDADTGEMLTGWQFIDGKQYYFAPASQAATYTFDESSYKWVYSNAANNRPYGAMYAGAITPDNQRVDADGARIQ